MGLHLPLSAGPGSRRVLPNALAVGLLLCAAACGDDTGDGSIDAGSDAGRPPPSDGGVDGGRGPDAGPGDAGPDRDAGPPGPLATAFADASRAAFDADCACRACDPGEADDAAALSECIGRLVELSEDPGGIASVECLTGAFDTFSACAAEAPCDSEPLAECNDDFSAAVGACDRPQVVLDAERECRRRLGA